MTWLLLRKGVATIQAFAMANKEKPSSKELVVFASKIPKESVIDIFGEITKAPTPITSATQSDIEVTIQKIYVISASVPELPFQLEDASKTELIHAGSGLEVQHGEVDTVIRVGQDLRLNNRWLDMRTNANQGIFKIQSAVCTFFRSYFLENGFVEIHSPKIIPGTSEGGSEIFRLNYFGRPACLAQSPQLYKQMGVMSDLTGVFEIGPVFRAENSNTHRHMCEFVGLDFEMEIKEHYHEILHMLGNLFVYIFDHLNEHCQPELAAIQRQYPFRPLKYKPKNETLVIDFREAVKMLQEAGEKIGPTDDFSTPQEKKIGPIGFKKIRN
jgi:aspartyl-tRNA synthetase